MNEVPLQSKYIMPAEWEKHSALWIAWPHDVISFPALEKVEKAVLEIIYTIHKTEQVNLLVLDSAMQSRVAGLIQTRGGDVSKVTFHTVPYMNAWMRDCGPCFVQNTETRKFAWVKWDYNVYGGKFPDLLIDDTIMHKLQGSIDAPMCEPGIVMEGGAFEVNGAGTLMTTEQCLLNKNRNPHLSKQEIEGYLTEYLGATNFIWLRNGLVGDHTDGHIDDIARFVSRDTIVCAYEDDEHDANYAILKENYEALIHATDEQGNAFKVIKLPMAHVEFSDDKPFEKGEKAPASYTNFYIGNGVVLVPIYNDPNDTKALETIQSCFPDRNVVGIDCSDIIYGGGAIHCLTQQQPTI
jgi:agmatine deiminase